MKYTIHINQFALYTAGLLGKVDYSDIAILEYLKDFVFYPQRKSIYLADTSRSDAKSSDKGPRTEYIWLNYRHLIASLPFANFKGKSAVSKRIAKLRKLDLIKTYQAKDNSLYYTLTDKMIDLLFTKHDITSLAKKTTKPALTSAKKTTKPDPTSLTSEETLPVPDKSFPENKMFAPKCVRNANGFATMSDNVYKVLAQIRERQIANGKNNPSLKQNMQKEGSENTFKEILWPENLIQKIIQNSKTK